MVTPFAADGTVDHEQLSLLTARQIAAGADFLCILCTTSETPCLSPSEQRAIQDTVVATNRGRLPIVLGIGGNNTAAVADTLRTVSLTGIDAILSVCPYYNKPSQEGLYQHFRALAAVSPLPIIIYNVPPRTGVNILAPTVVRLARDCENIIGIKEASGLLAQVEEIVRLAPPHFAVLSGDDALTREMLSLGAVGAISVAANAYPAAIARLVRLAMQGDDGEAAALDRVLRPLYKLLFADGNPAGIKAVLSAMGLLRNRLRLPLVPVQQSVQEKINTFVATTFL